MGRRLLASTPMLLAAAVILPSSASATPPRFQVGAAVATINPSYPVYSARLRVTVSDAGGGIASASRR